MLESFEGDEVGRGAVTHGGRYEYFLELDCVAAAPCGVAGGAVVVDGSVGVVVGLAVDMVDWRNASLAKYVRLSDSTFGNTSFAKAYSRCR